MKTPSFSSERETGQRCRQMVLPEWEWSGSWAEEPQCSGLPVSRGIQMLGAKVILLPYGRVPKAGN